MATSLRGMTHIGTPLQTDLLEFSLYAYFQWGLANAGGYFNVSRGAPGAYGGDMSSLRPVTPPAASLPDGKTWEGARKDWVYESGLSQPTQPTAVAGVWVNGTFYPLNTTGAYAHRINYQLGQVVFNSPIATTSTVQVEYSYRFVHLTTPDTPWWREFQYNSFRFDDLHFQSSDSKGEWNILSEHRVQLPAVVIEATPISGRIPHNIGSNAARLYQKVYFHVFTEAGDRFNAKQLPDIITNQWHTTVAGLDKASIMDDAAYPLLGGFLNSGGLQYPQLVAQYPWKNIRITKARGDYELKFKQFTYVRCSLECEIIPI